MSNSILLKFLSVTDINNLNRALEGVAKLLKNLVSGVLQLPLYSEWSKMFPMNVEILLATYNGEKFIHEQLQSIAEQTWSDFRVTISDGGSTDGTLGIVKLWTERDQRFRLLPQVGRLGVQENFSRLMGEAQGDYLFFADQDDVWKKEKLSLFLAKMEQLENEQGKEKPLLVHSDLEVVDEILEKISPSFWQFICLDPKGGNRFSRMLLQNTVTGAACLINRPLLELAHPIPKEAVMHDWWVALVACAFGAIGVVDETTVFYRQHGKNAVGAKPYFSLRLVKFAISLLLKGPDLEKAKKYGEQVNAFANRYHIQLSAEQQVILSGYRALSSASAWKRVALAREHRFYHSGRLRNIAFLLFSR